MQVDYTGKTLKKALPELMVRDVNMAILMSITGRFRRVRNLGLPGCHHAVLIICCIIVLLGSTGCRSVTGVPVSRLPRQLLDGPLKDDFVDINMLRLRQDSPSFYALGPGDVLGLHIPDVFSIDGNDAVLPSVHFPEDGDLPPAVGSPVVVREDGTVTLPYIHPVYVEGMSLVEATDAVQNAYTQSEKQIARDDAQVILTMIRRRTVRVLVIREESGGVDGVSKRGTGHIVDLPAYENDVLHALSETGGMPGMDAENQVYIYRGMMQDGISYDTIVGNLCLKNCEHPCFCNESPLPDSPNVTKIPLRYHPSVPPTFAADDILLDDGDILIIRSRDQESFYTAGLLGGGEYLLPRDRDLDVLGAIAVARGPIGNFGTGIGGIGGNQGLGMGQGGSGRGLGGGGYCQPSEVIVIRDLPCGNQMAIKVDLNRAIADRSERIMIKPGDIILLRYTLTEEFGNMLMNVFQINYIMGNRGGGF